MIKKIYNANVDLTDKHINIPSETNETILCMATLENASYSRIVSALLEEAINMRMADDTYKRLFLQIR